MAGDWIKMRSNLWDDPRVSRLCDLTDESEAAVVGSLYWLWATADQHSEDGKMPGLTARAIDRKTGVKGLGEALLVVGWIEEYSDGLTIVRFGEHNGASAKRRCTEAKRKGQVRKVSARDADKTQTKAGQDAELEKEKEKEKEIKQDQNTMSTAGAVDDSSLPIDSPPKVPDCPHQQIIDLYHQYCPTMRQVKIWNADRRKHLQTRWRENTKHQSLDFWARFFEYANTSEFLRGDTGKFAADLEWLIRPTNFAKVIEGKYENQYQAEIKPNQQFISKHTDRDWAEGLN